LEEALLNWLPSRSWFRGKTPTLKVHIQEIIPVSTEGGKAFFAFLQVEYLQTDPEVYLLPLACVLGEQADNVCRDSPASVVARLTLSDTNQNGVLYDALASTAFCRALLKFISGRHSIKGNAGELATEGRAPRGPDRLRRLRTEGMDGLEPIVRKAEQNNSSIIYGDRLILKLFRRLEPGPHPETEISRFLSRKEFSHVPPFVGALEYRGRTKELTTVGVLNAFVPGCKTGWEYTLDALSRFYDHVQTLPTDQLQAAPRPQAPLSRLVSAEFNTQVTEMIGTYFESALSLGRITAAMHVTLASEEVDPNFVPESLTPSWQRGFFQSCRNLTRQNFQLLRRRLRSLNSTTQAQAQRILEHEAEVLKWFRTFCERNLDVVSIRHHGNYHLGQVLYTGKEFLIMDFEGEPDIPLSERRLKRSPLLDVVAMIRSFRYAAHAALLNQVTQGTLSTAKMEPLVAWGRFWAQWVAVAFHRAYRQVAGTTSFLPSHQPDLQLITDVYLLRQTIGEISIELNRRPDWVAIPLEALQELLTPAKTE
jgi:maltose alpha-D-glucosyltransferase/alpha-amylase